MTALEISGYSRPEQFAYWFNPYKALTIQVVHDHYPVESIRNIDISPGLFADGPWKKKSVAVQAEKVSLDDVEHRILRAIWKDPRFHYAMKCASVGCPDPSPGCIDPNRLGESRCRMYLPRRGGNSF